MLTKTFLKTKGLYILMALVAVFLTTIVVVVLRTIFGALNTASSVDQEVFEKTEVRINKSQLEKAVKFVQQDSFDALDLR